MNSASRIKKFLEQDTLAKLVKCVKDFGAYHRTYCLYTSLDRVLQMMSPNYHRLWLTRLDSGLFDDGIEHKKYGSENERARTYIKSFVYGSQESAAMWGLYCPYTYKAIRMNITQTAIRMLRKEDAYEIKDGAYKKCEVVDLVVSDIMYAAVNSEDSNEDRTNSLFWNGVYSAGLKKLNVEKRLGVATGFVKDAEWRFQNECRLICKASENVGEHLAIDLPKTFFAGVSFVLSPWANEDEQLFVRQQLLNCFKNVGRKVRVDDNKVFRRSKLENGLQQWAKQRGL